MLPNDGSRVGPFKRKAPRLTTCEKLDSVSLFDFDQPDERIFHLIRRETLADYSLEWARFLAWYEPISVILTFSKLALGKDILGPDVCRSVGGQWIYNVEVCHRGPIDLASVRDTVIVLASGSSVLDFSVLGPAPPLDDLVASFK